MSPEFIKWITKFLADHLDAVVTLISALAVSLAYLKKTVVNPIKGIVRDFHQNGGSSLRDVIIGLSNKAREAVAYNFTLSEASDKGIWFSDKNGSCMYANDVLCTMMGRPASDVLGEGWRSCIPQRLRTDVTTEWDNAVKQHRHFQMIYPYINSHGVETSDYDVKGTPVKLTDGTVIGFIGFVKQIIK